MSDAQVNAAIDAYIASPETTWSGFVAGGESGLPVASSTPPSSTEPTMSTSQPSPASPPTISTTGSTDLSQSKEFDISRINPLTGADLPPGETWFITEQRLTGIVDMTMGIVVVGLSVASIVLTHGVATPAALITAYSGVGMIATGIELVWDVDLPDWLSAFFPA